MFYECYSLKEIDVKNFNTNQVIEMNGMFKGCLSLTSLNLSNFNINKVKSMKGMLFFVKCNIIGADNFPKEAFEDK